MWCHRPCCTPIGSALKRTRRRFVLALAALCSALYSHARRPQELRLLTQPSKRNAELVRQRVWSDARIRCVCRRQRWRACAARRAHTLCTVLPLSMPMRTCLQRGQSCSSIGVCWASSASFTVARAIRISVSPPSSSKWQCKSFRRHWHRFGKTVCVASLVWCPEPKNIVHSFAFDPLDNQPDLDKAGGNVIMIPNASGRAIARP